MFRLCQTSSKRIILFLPLFFSVSLLFSSNCISRSDSLILSRQSQVDSFSVNYSGCTRVVGKLIISGNNITSLQGLNVLTHIETLSIRDNPFLVTLIGLNGLETAGSIEVSHNETLLSLNGLESLDSVSSNLEVKYNQSLITMDGLNALQKVKGTLSIFSNDALSNLDGLEAVKSVNRLSIYGNPLLTSLLGIDSSIQLNIIDIWVNENLACCEVVNNIKANNPSILLNNIFSNAVGCSNVSEITSSSGSLHCCKTEFKVNTQKFCLGQSVTIGSHTYNSTGIYIDTFQTSRGCDSIIYTDLKVGQPSYSVVSKTLCTGQNLTLSNGRVVTESGTYIDTIPFSCDSILEYRLIFSDNTIIRQEAAVCEGQSYTLPDGQIVTESGIYTDTIRNSAACDSIIITTISYFPNIFTVSLPTQDTISAGDSLVLSPFYTNGNPLLWTWQVSDDLSCLDCEQPQAKPKENNFYEIKVKADNGCEDTARINIMVLSSSDIYVPNAFSPNNDGVNDFFNIFVSPPKMFSLKVFNRYGELVFFSDDINYHWDGMCKGESCPLDTYSYIIDLTLFNQQKLHKQGVVVLIR